MGGREGGIKNTQSKYKVEWSFGNTVPLRRERQAVEANARREREQARQEEARWVMVIFLLSTYGMSGIKIEF